MPLLNFHHIYHEQKYFGDVLSEQNLHESLLAHLIKVNGQYPEKKSLSALLKSKVYHMLISEILNEYAYFLGILCLDIFKIINPEMLVLSGTIPEYSPYIVEKVKQFAYLILE